MVRRILLLALCAAATAAPAQAFRLPADFGPLPGNPADRLGGPVDAEAYDPATHCSGPQHRKGVVALQRWLQTNSRGVFWGSYRCEKWGRNSASLHSEDRAIDWHPADRAAARSLIDLLLAPDAAGEQRALARRMGVEELIWDCSYWGAGMQDFEPYGYCFGRDGRLRRRLDPTAAHRDHIHIGMTKRGAAGESSFWAAR